MAFIMKEPEGNSKGIISFTHKELFFLSYNTPTIKKIITALKKKYVFTMHYGWNAKKNFKDTTCIDIYLAAPGCLTLPEKLDKIHIPLCSRNFIPEYFKPDPAARKHWDIICVAHTNRFKCLDDFLLTMKKLMDRRPETKILLLANDPETPDRLTHYTEIADDYKQLFSKEQQENFDFLLIKQKTSIYAVTQNTMPFFYNAARVFTIFTKEEGNIRVVGEAQLCGLPVVVRADLEGAGRDYLTEDNARLFHSLDEAVDQYCELLDQSPLNMQEEAQKMSKLMCEEQTRPALKAELEDAFKQLGEVFSGECDLDNLSRKLPCHTTNLPSRMRLKYSDDLKGGYAFADFAKTYCDVTELSLSDKITLWIYDLRHHFMRWFKKVTFVPRSRFKAFLRK